MRVLIDSHVLLWSGTNNPRLSRTARDVIGDPANEAFWSMATAWELTIKETIGKLHLPTPFQDVADALKLDFLPITRAHIACTRTLPLIHRDPFDRMLVAQAVVENMALVTCDRDIVRYPISTIW